MVYIFLLWRGRGMRLQGFWASGRCFFRALRVLGFGVWGSSLRILQIRV